ncbi:tetratricopeptide repeat protein [Qipengyuania sp. MTN3-11]|uniref:tetratricopeptide repeat protein n=1 Tax=Qipengyuania sp. MTN3-11 TaxID=3056557 RepID=UPI0036F2A0DD
MTWLPILALAALVFLVAAFLLKLPRSVWTLFGAALLFGLAGYATQGSPGQGGSPKQLTPEAVETGELIVEARREFFPANEMPSRFVVTADAFARRGDFAQSAQFLRNAVEENPQDTEAWIALGNALTEHADGQLTAAGMYAYSRAEQLAPRNPAAGYFAGLGLLRSGQPGRARAIWADLVASAPEDAEWRPALEERLARLDAMLAQNPLGAPQ